MALKVEKREFRFTPLKLVAVICGAINAILLIASVAGNQWIYERDGKKNSESLWQSCDLGLNPDTCKGWLTAVQAMLILGLLLNIGATGLAAWAYFQDLITDAKWNYYRISTGLFGGVLLFLLIGLSVYLGMTRRMLPHRIKGSWHIGWAHGLGWAAVIIDIVIIVLMMLPTEENNQAIRKSSKREVNYYDNDAHSGHM